jgi:hypothetical protein
MIIEELNHKAQLRINAKAPLYCIDEFTGFGISCRAYSNHSGYRYY